MNRHACALLVVLIAGCMASAAPAVSDASQSCIECHAQVTPGVVAAWRQSRHSQVSPAEGMAKPKLERRVSATTAPASAGTVVGCLECHGLNNADHADKFEHFGYNIAVVVSPKDCATCHPTEVTEYSGSKKANAHDTLAKNPLFDQMVKTMTTGRAVHGARLEATGASANAQNEACYSCHGTKIEVQGTRTVESPVGDVTVPKLTNWPNSGVGRMNPDGSQGACSACHTRHSFSIEMARKPATCGHCHLLPDVPAYEVYKESRHGNLYDSLGSHWKFDAVPWVLGRDIEAPTCATCHNSLVVAGETEPTVLAQRTHDFGSRLWVRIFGLPYSHPQPTHGRTWELRNAEGQPLPTSLDGKPAPAGLIGAAEQAKRQAGMSRVCSGCHSSSTPTGHFERFARTVAEADGMVKASTDLLKIAWQRKLADPTNLFDEHIEHLWTEQWLDYANCVRLGSAMAGPDYLGFDYGWYHLNRNLQSMGEWLVQRKALAQPTIPVK
ncbi:MAG: hydroxylamine oxidase [Armatimonadetes bacterium]|nr:hydroxylamine oxidase [Armatimonadota bacterium]